MTRLTYKIIDANSKVIQSGISDLEEARAAAAAAHGKYIPEYTTIREKTHFDRSKCRKSPEWLARHSN